MRNLTIKRHKSFVGSLVADKVYIRDELAGTVVIEGVPCRKLGEIKNGKEATFQIGDEEQKVFVIADQMSKEYCNASMTVPAGSEDVILSGKHHFVLGSNPFRFDGQEATPEQKKKGRKGAIIWICALIVGTIVGVVIGNLIAGGDPDPKTFTKEDFTITLTEEFTQEENEGEFVSFDSETVLVWTLREDKRLFDDEDITLQEYAEAVLEANGIEVELTKEGDQYRFEFTEKPDDQELYYLAVCSESEDAFWVTWFATPIENRDDFEGTFADWAKTIKVG